MRAVRDPGQAPEPGLAPTAPPIVPVPVRRRRGGFGTSVLFLGLVFVTVAGGAFAWLHYGSRITATISGAPDQTPLVKAETAPVKLRPSDPGGLEVPDRDKKIYDRFAGQPSAPKVEHLLPPPETPLPGPRPMPGARAPIAPPPPRPAEPLPPPVTEALPKVPTAAQVAAAPSPPPLPPTAAPPEPPSPPPAPVKSPAQPAPAPVAAKAPGKVQAGPGPAALAKAQEGATGGLQLQLAAVRQPDQAEKAWAKLKREHGDLLGDLKLFIVRADLGDKGVFYRVRVGPIADEAAARKRCADLAGRKVNCLIVRPGG